MAVFYPRHRRILQRIDRTDGGHVSGGEPAPQLDRFERRRSRVCAASIGGFSIARRKGGDIIAITTPQEPMSGLTFSVVYSWTLSGVGHYFLNFQSRSVFAC